MVAATFVAGIVPYQLIQELSSCQSGYGFIQESAAYVCPLIGDATVSSNFWVFFGYYCNHKVEIDVLSPQQLIERHGEIIYVYSGAYGSAYNRQSLEGHPAYTLEEIIEGKCGEKVWVYRGKGTATRPV